MGVSVRVTRRKPSLLFTRVIIYTLYNRIKYRKMSWLMTTMFMLPWLLTMATKWNNNLSVFGHVLLNHVTKTVKTSSFFECYNRCQSRGDCYSYNVHSNVHLCELNNATHLTNPDDLVRSPHASYAVHEKPIPSCDHVTCKENSTCGPVDDTYECRE
jgi:hypothetical protein